MHYWLMKSEPHNFSIEDLQARPQQREPWDGVRNYQARNMMRDQMKSADLAFFYHSNGVTPGIVGIVKIVREGYPDSTAFEPRSKHYDPKSDPANPRWYQVDVEFFRELRRPIPLLELKRYPQLAAMPLLRRGNRLSIMPVSEAEWHFILALEDR